MTLARSGPALESPPRPAPLVTRSQRPAAWAALGGVALVVVLALLPYLVQRGITDTLVNLYVLVVLATMWNVLAGYGGLISVGQQAYIGLGAYAVLVAAQHGVNPFVAVPIAAAVCIVLAVPGSWLMLRLSGGYFAIGTWVLAVVAQLIVSRFSSLGAGTGTGLPGLGAFDPVVLGAYTYWSALAVAVAGLLAVYGLLRSRTGLVLTAIRDNEVGARSVGGRIGRAKRTVYLLSAGGCGAAGAVLIISQLNVQPAAIFNVQWSADMIFAVLIGGIGSVEGPVLGAIAFIALQNGLAGYNAWYLIVLGVIAMAMAIWARRGLWGLFTSRGNLQLFPVGFWLHSARAVRRTGPSRHLLGPVKPPQPGDRR
ncbi:MAG: branched-chain amino acid ABC transporter permease [Acidimicrobiales bacterium]